LLQASVAGLRASLPSPPPASPRRSFPFRNCILSG
jgi:hypothetical protein